MSEKLSVLVRGRASVLVLVLAQLSAVDPRVILSNHAL